MVVDKRRFNRIEVSLSAVAEPVDMDLEVLQASTPIEGLVVNLSPTGLALYSGTNLRTGARYRVTLRLPHKPLHLFVLVKHISTVDNGTAYSNASGLQIVGATQEDLIELVKFLATVAKTQKL